MAFAVSHHWTEVAMAFGIIGILLKSILSFVSVLFPWRRLKASPEGSGSKVPGVQDIPGPTPVLPIIGTRWIFSWFGPYKDSQLVMAYKDMFSRYGPIVREQVTGGIPVVSVLSRADIDKVMSFNSKTPIRPVVEAVVNYRMSNPRLYLSPGLTNAQGEEWACLRTALTRKIMNKQVIQNFLSTTDSISDDFVNLLRLKRTSDNTVEAFNEYGNRLAFETMCYLVLGQRLGFLQPLMSEDLRRLVGATTHHFRICHETFYGFLPYWTNRRLCRELANCEEIAYEMVSKVLDKTLDEMEKNNVDSANIVFKDIISHKTLDVREKKAGIIDLIQGSIETIPNTLIFLLYQVAKHPDVQENMYQEIMSLAPPGTPITQEMLNEATYFKAVCKESYRVLRITPMIARILEADVVLSGYHVPKGTPILCHTWLSGLLEENFEEAENFKPERWLEAEQTVSKSTDEDNECDETMKQIPASSVILPFGRGRRICPGIKISEQLMMVTVMKMIREFYVEFPRDLETEFQFILKAKYPVTLALKDRHAT